MKRKLTKQVLSIVAAATMVVSLGACGSNGNGSGGSQTELGNQQETDIQQEPVAEADNSDSESVADDEEYDTPFGKYTKGEVIEDLGGYEFTIIDFGSSRWVTDEVESEEDQIKRDIIADVEEKFNCKITVESEGPDNIFENAQPAVMGGDKYADVIGITEWGFGKLLGANLLLDMNTVDSIDMSADYWNHNVIDFATFNGATYGIGGGFAPDLGNSGVVFYNQRIWDELSLPDPIELLEKSEWTWANLLEYAKAAVRDEDGDGLISSDADRYGVVGPHGGIAERMVGSMGEYFIANNVDGTVTLGLAKDEVAEKLNFIYNFFNTENVVCLINDSDYLDRFAAGGSLFMIYGNTNSDKLREMEDDFGVLPIPKWDAAQNAYYCQIDANAPIFCMTNTNQNTHEAGVIFSALARRYQIFEDNIITDRADTFWRLEETEDIMRDYVLPGREYDTVNLLKNVNDDFGKPTGILYGAVHENAYSDILSEMKAYEDQINIALEEFFEVLKK